MALLPATENEHAHTPLLMKPVAATGWGLFRGALVVAVMLLLVGALAWIVFGDATSHFVDTDAKRVLEREKILADRTAEDAKLLHDPASWMAKDKGIVRVPIDDAVKMTIEDLKPVQPHPAYPLKQSPPQPANAPTSPDKGSGAAANSATNPSASNPTVGQPAPAPVAASPVPAPATSAPNPAAPAAPSAPAAAAPTPAAVAAPSPDNNANNPGSPPVPGPAAQPAAPTPAGAPAAAPVGAGARPEPLMTPPSQPTPAASEQSAPTPAAATPGASPAGTP